MDTNAVRERVFPLAHLGVSLFFFLLLSVCAVVPPEQGLALDAGLPTAPDVSWYEDNPDPDDGIFEIQTAAELRGLALLVNERGIDFSGKTVCITGDIDFSENGRAVTDGKAAEFTPIGTEARPFAGTFEAAPMGDSYVISNLRVSETFEYAGLFGYASSSSCLRNVVLRNGEYGGIDLVSDSAYIGCVGSLAGKADGEVSGCVSDVQVSVNSALQATEAVPYVVRDVGGLVGYARGDMHGCAYTGGLSIEVASDAFDPDTTSDSLRVADSFGGVVGRFGDPDRHGVLEDSYNMADVVVKTTGDGGSDRFGTETHAVAFFVGGVVGYSNGSILRCHNGAYNELTHAVTGRVFTGMYNADGTTLRNNCGADQVGGIAGSLRGESDDPNKYNDGDPNDPMLVEDCYNQAQITGLVAVGGIVGQTGVYCSITRCYNGYATDPDDRMANQVAGKVISTRWNKPFSGGITGQCRSGTISYCANYAEIRNIQTGYYMAGIVGGLFVSDDYPNVTGEVFSCLNTGGVYTINESSNVEYREAGICGQNEGYVHDCIVLAGSVPYHSDSPIGNMDWGATDKLEIWESDDLQGSQSAAFLNAIAAQEQDWSRYWFINGTGFPVLNTWANLGDNDRVLLTSETIASCEQLEPAPYMGEGTASLPTLKVTLVDGTVLVQNADFRVIPQDGAYSMSGESEYSAGIEGLGMYRGTVMDIGKYAIGKGNLSLASLQITSQKYNFGSVVLPTQIVARLNGGIIDPDEYDFVVYNLATSASNVTSGSGAFAVYDSAGYVSYDAKGNNQIPVSSVRVEDLNDADRSWWLWDRNHEKISDSAGNSYYTTTSGGGTPGKRFGVGGNYATSCVSLKSGSPAGYVVKAEAKASSMQLEGMVIGYYVIDPVDLYRECTFEYATINGETWYWDADSATFYKKGLLGERLGDPVSVTFTGESIQPEVRVSYNDKVLEVGSDIRVLYGDPAPSEGSSVVVDDRDANRNVTSATTRNALTIAPIDTMNMSNYINAYFDIVPAKFEDCTVSLDQKEWAHIDNDQPIEPKVQVSLNGVKLREGTDYEVTYSNNREKGEAQYSVKPLENLSGGSMEPVTGTFEIVDGIDISTFTVADIEDQQFNYGYDVHPTLAFSDEDGNAVELEEGVDYTVAYSTKQVTKWSDSSSIDPCVATITGIGGYSGSLAAEFHIVPYDAAENSTNQLRVDVQDMVYGTWGLPGEQITLSDGSTVMKEPLENYGADGYPVVSVSALPIVDWAAYEAGDYDHCYGQPIVLTRTNNNEFGGLVNRYPVHYYADYGTQAETEVNGTGAVHVDANNNVVLQPECAQPGTYTVAVDMRTGTSAQRGGATGRLVGGSFEYTAPADIATVDWNPIDNASRTYTGKALTPILGVTKSGFTLQEGVDYEIKYADNIDVGTATYVVSAIEGEGSRFTGTLTGAFTVLPFDLSSGEGVAVGEIDVQLIADGEAAQPKPEVRVADTILEEDVDYRLSYRNNTAAGSDAVVRIEGIGNYTGMLERTFEISMMPIDIDEFAVEDIEDQVYSGSAIEPTVVVGYTDTDGGTGKLVEGRHFSVEYYNNVNVGTASFVISGIDPYDFQITKSFGILPRSIEGAFSVSPIADQRATGEPIEPAISVVDNTTGEKLGKDDYEVSYEGNIDPGDAKVTVTGKGNYCGSIESAFTIYVLDKAAQTISAKDVSLVFGKSGTLGAKLSTGNGKLSYKSSNTSVVKVSANGALTAVAAGSAKITITASETDEFVKATKVVKVTVAKASNTLTAKGKTVTLKFAKLKKKTLSIKRTSAITVGKAQGKVTYKKTSGNKKITVASNGTIKVEKGLKKGKYKLKVKVSAAGNANYKSATKTVTVNVKVK